MAEVITQWQSLHYRINRQYGRYDREFGMYDNPTRGEGKRIYDRAAKAYEKTRNIVEQNLRRKGLDPNITPTQQWLHTRVSSMGLNGG